MELAGCFPLIVTFLIQCISHLLSPWKATLFSFLHASKHTLHSDKHLLRSITIPHLRLADEPVGFAMLELHAASNGNPNALVVAANNMPPVFMNALLSIFSPAWFLGPTMDNNDSHNNQASYSQHHGIDCRTALCLYDIPDICPVLFPLFFRNERLPL